MRRETDNNATGMRDVWSWALAWYRKPPANAGKRARQVTLVTAYLTALGRQPDARALHDCYAGDTRWAVALARELCPRDWPALGIHACTAAAFGLRYVELATGRSLDPTALPTWLGEWSTW